VTSPTTVGRPGGRIDPDRLAELEEERRFLLRSLTDLEREHAAGDVDDEDYRTLRDGYTVRAAAVLRAIEEGRAALPPAPRRSWTRVVAGVVVVLAVAVGMGWFVARSSGQRLPGQEITGAAPGGGIGPLLAQARQLLGTDPLAAQSIYDQVLAERPDHPEALTYSGWLLAVNAQGASPEVRDLALDTSVTLLERAIESDPSYADPHCFLAIITANFLGDAEGGLVWAEECLAADPPADMRSLVEQFVLRLTEESTGGPTPTTAP
jgi:hypothetical protein